MTLGLIKPESASSWNLVNSCGGCADSAISAVAVCRGFCAEVNNLTDGCHIEVCLVHVCDRSEDRKLAVEVEDGDAKRSARERTSP